MGTPEFAVPSLERLLSGGHVIAGVFTKPDRPRNRGMKVGFSPVKEIAVSKGLHVFQPESLTDGTASGIIGGMDCDIIAVVAYGKILPRDMLFLPPMGCLNIHASLLPKYRGAAPVQWAILNGETETGVTAMRISEELDAGDVYSNRKIPIAADETAGQVLNKLSLLGSELLCETIDAISDGTAVPKPQIHSDATYAPPLGRELSPIDWSDSAVNIKRKVRGLNPWPVATAVIRGTVFKVFSVDIGEKKADDICPGEVISRGSKEFQVACADAVITINELQAAGGKRMPASEYLKGHTL